MFTPRSSFAPQGNPFVADLAPTGGLRLGGGAHAQPMQSDDEDNEDGALTFIRGSAAAPPTRAAPPAAHAAADEDEDDDGTLVFVKGVWWWLPAMHAFVTRPRFFAR